MSTVAETAIGPQTTVFSTFESMVTARRWLIADARKVPHYTSGTKRHGTLDTPADWAQLARYHEAKEALEARGDGWLLGFALGPDERGGHWQGIDFDDVEQNHLGREANEAPGYVEFSPSGKGAHAIGYGRRFASLGSNGSGVEAYAAGRFFTVTEHRIRDGAQVCLGDYTEHVLAQRHSAARATGSGTGSVELVPVDPKTVTELRSALNHMRSVDYHLWIRTGMALRELGETGRGLWLDWSSFYEKFDPKQANRKWDTFDPHSTGYQAVFAEATRQGWVNPASSAAQISGATDAPAASGGRELKGRSLGGVSMRAIEWLWTGWIPKGYITIFAGETGAGKSTVLADIAARITTGAPWPGPRGIPGDRREPGRVLWLGSEDSIEEMTIPRLTACRANLDNVIEIEGVMQQGKRNTFSMQDDIEAVGQWLALARAEGHPFAMLVIDPVTSYLPGQKLRKVDMNDAGQLRSILEPWLILAQRHNIAVVCVTHFAKDTSRNMLHRVLGSAAFAQTCRSLCAVIEPPATDDYEPEPFEKALLQVKVNLPEHPGGAWKFATERIEVGTDQRNGKPIYATRPAWDELDSALTPKTAVGRARGPKSQYELPFAMWLQAFFAARPEQEWLGSDFVMKMAVMEKVITENWWNKNSGKYLEKRNENGHWACRPKAQ